MNIDHLKIQSKYKREDKIKVKGELTHHLDLHVAMIYIRSTGQYREGI